MYPSVHSLMKGYVVALAMVGIAQAAPIERRANSGDATFYDAGLGACGIWNSNSDFIVAVSASYFDSFPGYTSGDPNDNPVCGRTIQASYQGKTIKAKITDRCVGCAYGDIDLTPTAFSQLAALSVGRLHDVSWWLV